MFEGSGFTPCFQKWRSTAVYEVNDALVGHGAQREMRCHMFLRSSSHGLSIIRRQRKKRFQRDNAGAESTIGLISNHHIELHIVVVVAGGADKLREKPFIVLYPEPISPLIMPKEPAERILIAADRGVPQMMGPAIQPGATGPVTMAGSVAQGVAESMFCVVVAQLRRPGCPVGLGCNFGILDMAKALMSVGSPEMSLALAAQAEVAQSLGLPSWGLAGATDSKCLDAQSGAEAAYHILAQGLSGLNMIHDVGYVDMSMACSVEQLVMSNDIIGMAKRFLTGMEVSDEHLALDVIAKVGPGGHYLQEAHTMKHFKKELWRPRVFTRTPFEQWKEKGSKTTEDLVREEIKHILGTHHPEKIKAGVLTELDRIKETGEKELLKMN